MAAAVGVRYDSLVAAEAAVVTGMQQMQLTAAAQPLQPEIINERIKRAVAAVLLPDLTSIVCQYYSEQETKELLNGIVRSFINSKNKENSEYQEKIKQLQGQALTLTVDRAMIKYDNNGNANERRWSELAQAVSMLPMVTRLVVDLPQDRDYYHHQPSIHAMRFHRASIVQCRDVHNHAFIDFCRATAFPCLQHLEINALAFYPLPAAVPDLYREVGAVFVHELQKALLQRAPQLGSMAISCRGASLTLPILALPAHVAKVEVRDWTAPAETQRVWQAAMAAGGREVLFTTTAAQATVSEL